MLRGATPNQYVERIGLERLLESGLITKRDTAIDGGAHVGTWSEMLRDHFSSVHAFEPGPAFEHLEINAREWSNVTCHNAALADEKCRVESWHRKPGAKLTAWITRKVRKGPLRGVPIDALDLPHCDLLKLDIEGFEYLALMGARQTIARCQPFILVEMAGRGGHVGKTDADVAALLESMNYERVWHYHVDVGFAPREVMS